MNKLLIRITDLMVSFLGLVILLPFLLILGIWISLDSKGSFIFRQIRVGKGNRDFYLCKFRTMSINSERGGLITVGAKDPRVTRAGVFLRKYKLDELPQLWNVLIGDMSLVGPRPEVRKYVEMYSSEQMAVLKVKPGITDIASITFSNENELLSKENDPEKYYVSVIMPEKIRLNRVFIDNPSWLHYLRIILKTVIHLFH